MPGNTLEAILDGTYVCVVNTTTATSAAAAAAAAAAPINTANKPSEQELARREAGGRTELFRATRPAAHTALPLDRLR